MKQHVRERGVLQRGKEGEERVDETTCYRARSTTERKTERGEGR